MVFFSVAGVPPALLLHEVLLCDVAVTVLQCMALSPVLVRCTLAVRCIGQSVQCSCLMVVSEYRSHHSLFSSKKVLGTSTF